MKTYATVDDWLADQEVWRDDAAALRRIVLAAGLDETVKWGQPCYTDRGRDIAIVSWRKEAAIVSFFQGALLDDPDGQLVQPGAVRSGRYLPFTTRVPFRSTRFRWKSPGQACEPPSGAWSLPGPSPCWTD